MVKKNYFYIEIKFNLIFRYRKNYRNKQNLVNKRTYYRITEESSNYVTCHEKYSLFHFNFIEEIKKN